MLVKKLIDIILPGETIAQQVLNKINQKLKRLYGNASTPDSVSNKHLVLALAGCHFDHSGLSWYSDLSHLFETQNSDTAK